VFWPESEAIRWIPPQTASLNAFGRPMRADGGLPVFVQHRLTPKKARAKRCSCCYFRLSAKLIYGRLRGLTGDACSQPLGLQADQCKGASSVIISHSRAFLTLHSECSRSSSFLSLSYSVPCLRSLSRLPRSLHSITAHEHRTTRKDWTRTVQGLQVHWRSSIGSSTSGIALIIFPFL
jgi:hypothetical protein